MVMIVAAWVSCRRFKVTCSPLRVCAVRDSGIGPTVKVPPGRHDPWAAGLISTAIPSRTVEGPNRTAAATSAARTFFTTIRSL